MDYSYDQIVIDNAGYPEVRFEETHSLYQLLENAARAFNDKMFLTWAHEDTVYERSYRDLLDAAKRVGEWASRETESLGHAMHAGFYGRLGFNYLAALFGVNGAGGVVTPLDVQLSAQDLLRNVNKADIDVLFYDFENISQVSYLKENNPSVKKFICIQNINNQDSVSTIRKTYTGTGFTDKSRSEDCGILLFTSGTTGEPKGVMLSNASLIDNVFCNDLLGDQYHEIALNVLPIHHVFCLNGDVFCLMRYGSSLAVSTSLQKLFKDIKLFRPTSIRMVPMMLKLVNNRLHQTKKQHPDWSVDSVRQEVLGDRLYKLVGGGGFLAPELMDSLAGFNIRVGQGYGMSEHSPKIAVPVYDRPEKRGSVGIIVRNCQTRLVDGELQVKGPSVMMGYYKDPEATKEAFTEDGWLRTGDLARIDEDNFIYLTGRKKNLIILSNGENVSPETIENLFDGDMLVTDIVALEENDQIIAEVYPNFEYADNNGIKDIKAAVKELVTTHNQELPTFARISDVVIRNKPFEKTSSRKIIRSKVQAERKDVVNQKDVIVKPENENQKKLIEIISGLIDNDMIGITTDLFAAGMDSMACIQLIEEVESQMGKILSYQDILNNHTVKELDGFLGVTKGMEVHPYQDKYPLTGMMMYFAYVIPGNTTGNLPFTFELDPNIDLERLKAAIVETINAHPGVKGMIQPDPETHYLALYRHDDWEPDVPIIDVPDDKWQETEDSLLRAFKYDGQDKLYHISLYRTETRKFMLFDVSHIMGDGISMNILLEDVNRAYAGKPVEKEVYTVYDYILDDCQMIKDGGVRKGTDYYGNLMKGYKLERSLLNKKDKEDLNHADKGVIRKRFDKTSKRKIQNFCKLNGVSENVLFLTSFNYTVGLFSGEDDVTTCSIHSGRTDGRWRRLCGCLFKTYYLRSQRIPHETSNTFLKRMGKQIMDSMQSPIALSREGEMFFQYQGDIVYIPEIGGLPAKPVHLQLDSLPFHMNVHEDNIGYRVELRFWKNRFDEDQLRLFLECYESVLNAFTSEPSARKVKYHLPDEAYPHLYSVTVGELNAEAGKELIKLPSSDKVKVYILDDHYSKKPFGSWGKLFIKDVPPVESKEVINDPWREGKLYDTGVIARIMIDGRIDFLENSGRVVLTDGSKGRKYYDLGTLENALEELPTIEKCHSFLEFDQNIREMRLVMNVETDQDSFINRLRSYAGTTAGDDMIPAVVNLTSAYKPGK
ncbi:MAG: AMP-binding protein [Oribacterium sp.]|nr:AMP-binding protein [Oribacterium sp.]